MSRYEIVVPPVRTWPRLFVRNYARLYRMTLGRMNWTLRHGLEEQ